MNSCSSQATSCVSTSPISARTALRSARSWVNRVIRLFSSIARVSLQKDSGRVFPPA